MSGMYSIKDLINLVAQQGAAELRLQPDRPPMILCVGRLSPVKDHLTLLAAAATLRARWKEPKKSSARSSAIS